MLDVYKTSNKLKGFTLIEILVVLGLVGLMTLIGTANLREYQRRQLVAAAVKQFSGDLSYARQLALTGKKPAGCGVLDGYDVKYVSSTAYSIMGLCDGNVEKSIGRDSNTLPNSATASSFGQIVFKELGHGTNLTSDLTITIGGAGGNQTVLVTVSGTIRNN
ncbi:prepilin-type N-terminal cleavage/methylation domain-containing protein [Candidatus Woesebacteria bacterium]|nr:prepilin-type N-terminal cleavage/methylation domain-containing protein [Candidatus Woesebacteria bacterium]